MKIFVSLVFILSLLVVVGCTPQTIVEEETEEEAVVEDSLPPVEREGGLIVVEVPDDSVAVQEEEPEAIEEELAEPEVIEVVEEPTIEESEEDEVVEESATGVHVVTIVGKDGFDPLDSVIAVGDVVQFVNPHNFGNVLIFKKHGRAGTFSSPTIKKDGGTWEKTFDEAGTYDVWAFAYGAFGTITVEE